MMNIIAAKPNWTIKIEVLKPGATSPVTVEVPIVAWCQEDNRVPTLLPMVVRKNSTVVLARVLGNVKAIIAPKSNPSPSSTAPKINASPNPNPSPSSTAPKSNPSPSSTAPKINPSPNPSSGTDGRQQPEAKAQDGSSDLSSM